MSFSGHLLVIMEIKIMQKYTVGGEFFFVVFVEAYNFGDLRVCVGVIARSGSGISGWCK